MEKQGWTILMGFVTEEGVRYGSEREEVFFKG
jgi:hypothetical protein